MKKSILLILVVATCFGCSTLKTTHGSDPESIFTNKTETNNNNVTNGENSKNNGMDSRLSDNEKYLSAVDSAISDLSNASFKDIKDLFVNSDYYNPYNTPIEIDDIKTLVEEEKFDEAAKLIEKHYRNYFAEFHLHHYAMMAFRGVEREDLAQWHRKALLLMLYEIESTGDGKTVETAFKVISVREEYYYMDSTNILYKDQHLFSENGSSYDNFEVDINDNWDSRNIFFNLDIPLTKKNNNLG